MKRQSRKPVPKNWNVDNSIRPLFSFILPMFAGVFGAHIMEKEICDVIISDSKKAPIMITNSIPIKILINADPGEWNRVIFQLAHELTHYAIRQNTDYKYTYRASSAFEEPLCEAMALYILKLCNQQWQNCEYFFKNQPYRKAFDDYRQNEYKKASGYLQLENYEDYKQFNNAYINASKRPDSTAMRNHLYDKFVEMPDQISIIIQYTLYMRDKPYELLADDVEWAKDQPDNREFIQAICSMQPTVTAS